MWSRTPTEELHHDRSIPERDSNRSGFSPRGRYGSLRRLRRTVRSVHGRLVISRYLLFLALRTTAGVIYGALAGSLTHSPGPAGEPAKEGNHVVHSTLAYYTRDPVHRTRDHRRICGGTYQSNDGTAGDDHGSRAPCPHAARNSYRTCHRPLLFFLPHPARDANRHIAKRTKTGVHRRLCRHRRYGL